LDFFELKLKGDFKDGMEEKKELMYLFVGWLVCWFICTDELNECVNEKMGVSKVALRLPRPQDHSRVHPGKMKVTVKQTRETNKQNPIPIFKDE